VPVQELGQAAPHDLVKNFRLFRIRDSGVPAHPKRFYMVHFCEFFNVNLDQVDCASFLALMAVPYMFGIVFVALLIECYKLKA
jgi:hypothetical protein